MKINWNNKYTTISVYAILVACGTIVFYLIASQMTSFQIKVGEILSVLMPFIIGFTMAYLFNFILVFYETRVIHFKVFDKMRPKFKRFLGLLLTYTTVVLLVVLFLNFVLPQLYSSARGLVTDIQSYVIKITDLFNDLNSKYEIPEEYYTILVEQLEKYRDKILNFATDLIPVLGNVVKTAFASLWNIVLGVIVSIYLLMDKEKFFGLNKKIIRSLFSEQTANRIIELTKRSNNIFGKFLSGKILDSFIIGVLTFIIITIFKMPYPILISFIIALTNIIPFFGPFIGAVPATIIILFVSPIQAFWFVIIIIIIQQIDGNIIGPKILGDSLGISAFWILFSLLVAGKIFGFIGLIVGVPLFVLIYSIIKDIVENRLKKKGLPHETDEYM